MAEINIKKEEVIFQEHVTLKKITYDIKKKNGQWEEQNRELLDHGNAVTILLYNLEQKTIVLIKQFRLATFVNGNKNGMLLETCAGLLEDGEAAEVAMLREIKEETGYEITDLEKAFEAYSSPGAFTELVYYFIAAYTNEQKVTAGGGLEEEGEEVKVVEMSFDEAFRMAGAGEIKDAKTLLMLYYVKAKGLFS